ncbi:hypothetical protein A9D60_22030 [Leisingera sp. JC1]|nr:hypothetical protein A9D60_22030 [Leisingera sp. JC1]
MHIAFQQPDPILTEVWTHWRAIEAQTNRELPEVLHAASLLLEADEEVLASRVLTEFSHARFDCAMADCAALADAAYARLRALGALNMTRTLLSPDQIW